jgi:hypothetical protein
MIQNRGRAPPQGRVRLAVLAETVEKQLVQDHRIHRDELLALEAVDQESRRVWVVELGELLVDHIQPLDRPAVVVLVVAEDQAFGHAFDPRRITGQRLHRVGHRALRSRLSRGQQRRRGRAKTRV